MSDYINMPVYRLHGKVKTTPGGVKYRAELAHQYNDFRSPITGYTARIRHATLDEDGRLWLEAGFKYDFGSWAVDTPAMVYASLPHDVFCRMTDQGELPYSVRKQADKYFRDLLKRAGVSWWRRQWCYLAVRTYSTINGWGK